MTLRPRDIRALVILGVAMVGVAVYVARPVAPSVVSGDSTVPAAELRLDRLRRIAATIPAKDSLLRQAQAELDQRERNVLHSNTAPEAQAQLLATARRLATAEKIDLRSAEFGQPKPLGDRYGEVTAATTFECHIEQFLNFMAALSRESDLIAPSEIRVTSNNNQKIIVVRMALSGVVPRKLVPEKKGFVSF